MKRLQNKISESALTLPVVAVLAFLVWVVVAMTSGSRQSVYQQCPQLVCLAASTYLMVELSNANSLLRVRSRMVSATFLILSSISSFLIPSLPGGIAQLCFIGMLTILLRTYQDKQAPGWTFYAFLCLGLGSLVFAHILLLVPLLWLLMATQLQSHSIRNYLASAIGLLTPYWFIMPWVFYKQDFTPIVNHFLALASLSHPNYATLTVGQFSAYAFTIVLAFIGILHFWLRSYEDKIRIRQFYGLFIALMLTCAAWLALQPQLFDGLMRIIIVCSSPIIAHFFVHTSTRTSNSRLSERTAAWVARAEEQYKLTGQDQKVYYRFMYRATRWERAQWIVVKIEYNAKGKNVRYVVTDMYAKKPQNVYENWYCKRGNCELYIKEMKDGLKANRMSCGSFSANQFRLFLHAAAYVLLLEAKQTLFARNESLATATIITLRKRIILQPARITELKTKIKIEFQRDNPMRNEILQALLAA